MGLKDPFEQKNPYDFARNIAEDTMYLIETDSKEYFIKKCGENLNFEFIIPSLKKFHRTM